MDKTETDLRLWIEEKVSNILSKLPHEKQLLAMGYLAGLAADATLQEEKPEQQPPAP